MSPEEVLRELRDPHHWRGLRTPRSGRSSRPALVPARLLPAIAALVIAALAAAGIGLGFASLPRSGAPADSGSALSGSDQPTTPAGRTFTGVAAGSTTVWSGTRTPPGCTFDDLDVRADPDGGGAAGTYIHALHVRERSTAACLLPTSFVTVGGVPAPLHDSGDLDGGVLGPGDVVQLLVSAPSACGPTGTQINIDRGHLRPIGLELSGSTRATTATFPATSCSAPYVDAVLDPDDAGHFGAAPALSATASPVTEQGGVLHYSVTLRYRAAEPVTIQGCFDAVEVIRGTGGVAARSLTLSCVVGSTLRPGSQVTFPVRAPEAVHSSDGYAVSWYIPQQSSSSPTPTAAPLCTAGQLAFAPDGDGGGEVGVYFGHLRATNDSDTCRLAVAVFEVGGRVATGRTSDLVLRGRASSVLLISAAQRCGDGQDSANVSIAVTSDASDRARYEEPIRVHLGGATSTLDVLYPRLACSPASIEVQSER